MRAAALGFRLVMLDLKIGRTLLVAAVFVRA